MNLCSKCFRDMRIKNEQAKAKAAMDKLVNKVFSFPAMVHEPTTAVAEKVKVSNRCSTCNKKVGVMGFKCKCGEIFCGSHRYPEEHDCEFDFKRSGRDDIAKANPVMKVDKVNRI
ncbi:hypothetical protein L1987_17715 [Smallanthus sonchifolius]|uniref:Uncharacterized protein n=1 Tax=Smallanthus sonchifolius TaxID=185202 RepID=A0ACB9IYT7_9ASTR|nr:hypothetical protein L1987_17715 [Smallanthus sonchifolius]